MGMITEAQAIAQMAAVEVNTEPAHLTPKVDNALLDNLGRHCESW